MRYDDKLDLLIYIPSTVVLVAVVCGGGGGGAADDDDVNDDDYNEYVRWYLLLAPWWRCFC